MIFDTIRRSILLFFMIIFAIGSSAQKYTGFFHISGRIRVDAGDPAGTVVTLINVSSKTNENTATINSTGKFEFDLKYFKEYRLTVAKDDHYTKDIDISTIVPPQIWAKDSIFPPFTMVVTIYKKVQGVTLSFEGKTVGKLCYNPKGKLDNFDSDIYINDKDIRKEIDQALKAQEDERYNKKIAEAVEFEKKNQIREAINAYEEALAIRKNDQFVKPKIRELTSDLKNLEKDAKTGADRLAAEKAKAEADRLAAEKAKAEADRLATEKAKAEADRLAAEKAKAEGDRIATAKAKAEADRLAAEKAKAEADRLAAEKAKAEADRLAAEKAKAEADRLAAVKADRLAAEKAKAEADRLAAEKAKAEADRLAVEKAKVEADRLATEKAKAEAARLAAEKAKTEADRLAAEKAKAEADRLAAEKAKAEADRLAAEKAKAEADRIAAEEKAKTEAARLAAALKAEKLKKEAEQQNKLQAEDSYLKNIQTGDANYAKSLWSVAIFYYQEALKFKSTDKYAIDRVDNCRKMIDSNVTAEKMQEYNSFVKQADSELQAKKYSAARFYYSRAGDILPWENYPKDQLKQVEKLISSTDIDSTEAGYFDAIKNAEDAVVQKNYAIARFYFQKAISLKPNEEYPKQQLKRLTTVDKP